MTVVAHRGSSIDPLVDQQLRTAVISVVQCIGTICFLGLTRTSSTLANRVLLLNNENISRTLKTSATLYAGGPKNNDQRKFKGIGSSKPSTSKAQSSAAKDSGNSNSNSNGNSNSNSGYGGRRPLRITKTSAKTKKSLVKQMGYTPARFQLLNPVSEQGKDLLNASGERSNVVARLEELRSNKFEEFGLNDLVCQSINQVLLDKGIPENNIKPTIIQALSIPEILKLGIKNTEPTVSDKTKAKKNSVGNGNGNGGKGTQLFLAAETGSGKTFAYLLPLLSNMKDKLQQSQIELKNHGESKIVFDEDKPKIMIITPTKELASQTLKVCKSLCHAIKFKAELISNVSVDLDGFGGLSNDASGKNKFRNEDEYYDSLINDQNVNPNLTALKKPKANEKKVSAEGKMEQGKGKSKDKDRKARYLDVVVGTPHDFKEKLKTKRGQELLSQIDSIVIDEADTMMDDKQGHTEDTLQILGKLKALDNSSAGGIRNNKGNREGSSSGSGSGSGVGKEIGVVFVSATIPKSVKLELEKIYPEIRFVASPYLHQINKRLRVNNIDVTVQFQGSKFNALKQAISDYYNASSRIGQTDGNTNVMVFCNTKVSAVKLYDKIMEQNTFPNVLLLCKKADFKPNTLKEPTFDARSLSRRNVVRAFNSTIGNQNTTDQKQEQNGSRAVQGGGRLKVLICTDLASRGIDTTHVDHVVMYDYPTTAINYLHRCGRTGRLNSVGKVTCLVGKNDRQTLQKISLFTRHGVVM
ncbi:ATP-dependent RNA helicase mrh4, mitochondrial [Zancudomyces culisetae]|uniref:ATP-dependent RNA helicase mrh4, mitochondrial n=1 Tax=Zancudomyces culisetae TaxID=1213189 RepID=A0A1R1PCZ1_ZANCU|nr:ATP-dependent RNA helicase mrh4, mitochondrial [Zancudomyces culisetae]|eukprot:OMH78845.1 ATP-dependent RNA helicase mrh4, mitochondrial [Zancudomyces culisetae]